MSCRVLIIAWCVFLASSVCLWAQAPVDHFTCEDRGAFFIYDFMSGDLRWESPRYLVALIRLKSAAGLFQGDRPNWLTGPIDSFTPAELIFLDAGGFSYADFGPVLPAGLTRDVLAADLNASIAWKGTIETQCHGLRVVPEPLVTGHCLVGGWLAVVSLARRRRRFAC